MHQHPGRHLRAQRRRYRLRQTAAIALLASAAAASRSHAQMISCAASSCHERTGKSRVAVLEPLLAQRIEHIASESPTFRNAWQSIQESGLKVRVGTDQQLHNALPQWYRQHPNSWAGVMVVQTDGGDQLRGAVVAVRLSAIRDNAQRVEHADDYLMAEIDRVLIHEIYGHLAPIVASRDLRAECLDQHRPGEIACVQRREQQITAELAVQKKY